jgi:hypothetical protein
LVDDDDDNLLDPLAWYMDEDEDGFGTGTALMACSLPVPGYVLDGSDCDDESIVVNPASNELCGDELDNDCDGLVDDTDDEIQVFLWGFLVWLLLYFRHRMIQIVTTLMAE